MKKKRHWTDTLDDRMSELMRKEKEFDELQEKYWELLHAVESKYQNESRHETALRYIKQVESTDGRAYRSAV